MKNEMNPGESIEGEEPGMKRKAGRPKLDDNTQDGRVGEPRRLPDQSKIEVPMPSELRTGLDGEFDRMCGLDDLKFLDLRGHSRNPGRPILAAWTVAYCLSRPMEERTRIYREGRRILEEKLQDPNWPVPFYLGPEPASAITEGRGLGGNAGVRGIPEEGGGHENPSGHNGVVGKANKRPRR